MKKIIRDSLLYTSCILFPIICYIYIKKIKHGIIFEVISVGSALIGMYVLMYSFGRYGIPIGLDISILIFSGIGILIISGSITMIDSVLQLRKFLKMEKRN